jgi:hypothetical protein
MEQIPLFGRPGKAADAAPPPPDPERTERLNRAVDRIREKFGAKGIVPGALPEDPTGE